MTDHAACSKDIGQGTGNLRFANGILSGESSSYSFTCIDDD